LKTKTEVVTNHGVLSAVGNTPLIALDRLFGAVPFRLYAKMEGLNPGGSMKDRPAALIVQTAWESGEIGANSVIVESSSGNMGIGLAQACSYYGLRFICVVDPKTTLQNINLLKVYGAEVDMVAEPDPVSGEFLQARINRVTTLLGSIENSFWPNQYSNPCNAIAHRTTMREIHSALGHEPDYLFCATSTCGTLRGCSEYIAANRLATTLIAVDAVGSVIFGSERGKRLIPGHGAAVRPALFDEGLTDTFVLVSDLDCVLGCRRLVKEEAILAGGSSGAIVAALDRLRNDLPANSTCVMILPDRGERYLDTIYSDAWVCKHFGEKAGCRC